MDDDVQIPADLCRLSEMITSLTKDLPPIDRKTLLDQMEAVIESTKRRRRILSLVQDSLSQLRLDMKYLMFDLEATRRERDELRHD